MNIESIVRDIKQHPDFRRAGMVLIHNGVVRGTSRSGATIHRLSVRPDRTRLKEIIDTMKRRPGIIDIVAEVAEGDLSPGDDIMAVAVAGDYRENVFPVLMETVELIKRDVTEKREG